MFNVDFDRNVDYIIHSLFSLLTLSYDETIRSMVGECLGIISRARKYFDKITNRLRKLKQEGNLDKVDPVLVAQKVIENLYDGITTFELDEQSTRVCAQFSSTEPEYGLLGSRICVSNLHKSTPSSFSDCI